MATTTLLPRRVSDGKSILTSIKDSLDYGKNPSKTCDGKLISYYECNPKQPHTSLFYPRINTRQQQAGSRAASMMFCLIRYGYHSNPARLRPKKPIDLDMN